MNNRLSRLEAVQTVLLEIGQRSASCSDISEFLRAVHAALGRIMYSANFYVALHEQADGTLHFPYFVDEFDIAPDLRGPRVVLGTSADSPSAWVILNRQALVMTAAQFAEKESGGRTWGGGTAAVHWMGCPLLDHQHQALGAIVIQSYDARYTFSEEDEALFALIANHVSSALQGLQSMDRLERAVQERTALLAHEVAERRRAEDLQHALYEMASLSAMAADTDTLYARLHAIVSELVVAKNFMIGLRHPDTGQISIPYFVDEKVAEAVVRRFHYGVGMSSYVLNNKQACLLDAAGYAALVTDGAIEAQSGDADIASWMGAPMLLADQAYGVIIVRSYDQAVRYGQADLDILAFMASHVAVAIARIQADRSILLARDTLAEQNAALSEALTALRTAQSELVRQEKLASLGRLVAGVAHEINTPLGICVTATSHLVQELKLTREDLAEGRLDEGGLEEFFGIVDQSLRIMTTNTQRAAALVRSFKRVAVDQSSDAIRDFNLRNYLDEVLLSLQPKLKGKQVKVEIVCPADIELESFPGAVSQIITNLVVNSLVHGFEEDAGGRITITARLEADQVYLDYRDDGAGMDADTLRQLFDPFFTTKRGQGGSGLGAHILYNLVTGPLGGVVQADSTPGEGLHYHLRFPRSRAAAQARAPW